MESSERRVAVVGDDRAAALRRALAGLPYRSVERSAADAVVAVGDEALRDALVDAPDAPVIPVGSRRIAVDIDVAERRVNALLDAALRSDGHSPVDGDPLGDDVRRVAHPVLAVDAGDGETRRAAFDVALVTAEPARISEFAVGLVGGPDESFRADGVVVATPLGSDGYANAAGGPVVEPGGGLSVAPIAPFSTRTDAWVAAGRLSLSVERETESVALVVDGRERGSVVPHRPVAIEAVDSVALVTLADPRRARRSETL
ncbi:NAD(+)/NADH kinase [Halorubrum depositum]|uniref:NAD(+)/NADH kinase n=1 Tax=Halorubrum depositum TaxID=2583992 RepID=UPI0011A33C33|nr:NAD(+)/NADH kinase [Halorubrum depositum]